MPSNEYMRAYMAARREKRRSQLVEMAGGVCQQCGSKDDLEFNHIDRSKKSFGLSGAGLDKAWATILEEFDKCNLLCVLCHQSFTASQYGSGEIVQWSKGLNMDLAVHGTAKSYNEMKCKCVLCKEAKRLYRDKKIGYTEKVVERTVL